MPVHTMILEKATIIASVEDLRGKENNDNFPPKVGDWVQIPDVESLRIVQKELGQEEDVFVIAHMKERVAFLVSRKNYKRGMYIPTTTPELQYKKYSKLRFRGMRMEKLRIVPKPVAIVSE